MLQVLTKIGYLIHIGGGFVGLVSGTIALLAPKGRSLHRTAGNIFFVSMVLMAAFAIYLAVAIPDELVNVFVGAFAWYLVGTAWLTVKRRPSFTSVLAIAAISDAKVVFAGGISGTPRIARHLWRMCLRLTLAAGSGFTNGFARLLPGPYHVPPAVFLPQFIPLGFLALWMIRVRLTAWSRRRPLAQ